MNELEKKMRIQQFILLGRERGFVTRAEVKALLEQTSYQEPGWHNYQYRGRVVIDDAMIEEVAQTFGDMGVEVRSEVTPTE